MHILNRTGYLTSDLRSLCGVALRADEAADGPMQRRQRDKLKVEVVHTRQRRGVSGYAFYNGTRMRLRLPKDPVPTPATVIWLFLHELQHIRGAHHRQMSDKLLRDMASEVMARHPELVLRAKPVSVTRPKPPLRLVRYEHAKAMLAKKEAAVSRLERQAAKWRQRVRYYERAQRTATTATVDASGNSLEYHV